MAKTPKRPRDTNQLAKFITDLATGDASESQPDSRESGKNPAAVALGRLGGLKGGAARRDKLSAEKRREIATQAAQKRWNKD